MAFHWVYKDGNLYGAEDDTRIEVHAMGDTIRIRLYMGDEVLERRANETGTALLWAFKTLSARTVSNEMMAVFKLVEGTCLDDPLPF